MIALQSTLTLLQETFTDMLKGAIEMIPKVLLALAILIIGYIAAKIIRKVITKVLKAAKIDNLGEALNKIDIVSKSNMEIKLSSFFGTIVYYLIMLMVLIMSSTALGVEQITQLMTDFLLFIPNVLVAIIILIVGTLVADAIKNLVQTALKSLGVPSAGMIASALFYFLFINVIMISLKQSSIQTDFLAQNISILIAGLIGAFAIGYGLASKDTMANLLASLYSKNVFNIGDKVTIEGVTGVISDIDKSKITIDTETSKVVLPLAKATNQKVEFHK